MKLAIVGTGTVGETLTRGFIRARYDVVLGARDPKRPVTWLAQLAARVQVGTPEEAVRGASVVINCTPGAVSVEAFTTIEPAALEGKVLVDVANAISPHGDRIDLVYPNGSLGEELQLALPDVRVVKTLNTMSAGVMTDPGGLPAHSSVFVAGDDDGAKQTVAALLGDLGWPADSLIDLGGIAAARGPEHAFYLLGALFGALGTPRLNFAIIR